MDRGLVNKAKETMSDPDIITDMYDNTVAWISKKFTKRTGYTMKDFEGRKITDYFRYDKKGLMKMLLNISLKKSGLMEVKVFLKSGKKVTYNVSFCKLKYKDGFYHVSKIMN